MSAMLTAANQCKSADAAELKRLCPCNVPCGACPCLDPSTRKTVSAYEYYKSRVPACCPSCIMCDLVRACNGPVQVCRLPKAQ